MTKLLSCPFCGVEPDVGPFGSAITIHCSNEDCDVGAETSSVTIESAAASWNKRAPAQEWQDISTAPKDGRPIIYQDSDEAVSTCSWQEDDCGSSWWDIAGDQLADPVRWMPLPPVAIIADDRGTK